MKHLETATEKEDSITNKLTGCGAVPAIHVERLVGRS